MTNKDKIRATIIQRLMESGQVTRPELIEELNIRPATLFDIVNSLKEDGIVAEPERKGKKTGRKASPLCLNGEHALFLGVGLKKECTVGVLIDMEGKIISEEVIKSTQPKDIEASFAEMDEIIKRLQNTAGENWKKVVGAGFAAPGLTDIDKSLVIKAVNIPGYDDIDLGKHFKEKYNLDSRIYPGASARAHMEYISNNDPEGSLFHMELGGGIGAGFIKNGEVFLGDTCCAMEVGHIVVNPGGVLCQCGNRGCLETVSGEDGIQRKVQEIIESGVQTELTQQEFSIPFFVECVHKEDKAACALALEVSEFIGIALSSVVSLLNPSHIVFTGALAALNDFLITAVQRTLSLRCFPLAMKNMVIRCSELPETSSARGAALLMRSYYLLG